MAEEKSKDEKENERQPKATPIWESIIAAVGLILVLGAVGSTVYRALTEANSPPKLEVAVDSIEPSGDKFLVRFRVTNAGGQTAAAVTVEGELINGSETAETSSATLAYAPAHSTRRGGLYFTQKPDFNSLKVRAAGYEEP